MENKTNNSYLENLRRGICPKCSQVGEMTYTGDTENYQNMGVVFRCTNEHCKGYDKKIFIPLDAFKKPSADLSEEADPEEAALKKEKRLEEILLEFIEREAGEKSSGRGIQILPQMVEALFKLWGG